MSGSTASIRRDGERQLQAAAWLILIGFSLTYFVTSTRSGATGDGVLHQVEQALLIPFFALVIARLALVAIRHPDKRLPVAQVILGLGLWGVASEISLLLDGSSQPLYSPAAAEGVYLAGATCIASFAIIGRSRRVDRLPIISWLTMVVLAGALISLFAAASELAAARNILSWIPVSVMINVLLLLIVLLQATRGLRSWRTSGVRLVVALVLMIGADLVLRAIAASGATEYPLGLDLAWAAAALLIADAASADEPPTIRTQGRIGYGSWAVLGALSSNLVLALLPPGSARTMAIGPALTAVVAATAIAVLALRQARTAAEAVQRAETDQLTGLPNRRAVFNRLGARDGSSHAVILLDQRRFKDVNDTLGHSTGDLFLQLIGGRIREATPQGAMVARVGADQFCVLLRESDQDEVFEVAAALLEVVRRPIPIDGLTLTPDWHVGMAVGSDAAADLLRQADIALFRAKESGRPTMFDASLDTFSRAKLELGEELRQAIVSDQLEVWYQPQLTLLNDQVDGVEALVRWRHPTRGLVPPGEFLDASRRLGLMPALTEIIMRIACRQAAEWRRQGIELRVSINVGADELLSPTLMGLLLELIAAEGLPERSVTVEVTEESFLVDRSGAQSTIRRLEEAGVDVSVDDYGTGFSSLAYLRHLPLRELKIDHTFIMQVCDDARSRTIVAATAALAHALDMRVVAEGIESEQVLDALRDLQIDVAQGYHIARPMPPNEMTLWLRNQRFTATEGLNLPFLTERLGQPGMGPGLIPQTRSAAEAASTAIGAVPETRSSAETPREAGAESGPGARTPRSLPSGDLTQLG